MLLFPIARFRKRRGKTRRVPPAPPPPAALTLVSAVLESFEDDPRVRLTFGRAIDLTGFDPAMIFVEDPVGSAFAFVGAGVFDVPDAQSVVVALAVDGLATGAVTVLTASPDTGIVADDDGGTWAGVTALPLPFP